MLRVPLVNQENTERLMKEYRTLRDYSPTCMADWSVNAADLIGVADRLIDSLKNARFDEDGVHYHCYECGDEATKEFPCGMRICSLCLDMYDYRDCEECDGRHEACLPLVSGVLLKEAA